MTKRTRLFCDIGSPNDGPSRRVPPKSWAPTAAARKFTRDIERALARADSTGAIFEIIANGASRLGFEHCAYGIRLPTSATRPTTLMVSSYDSQWRQRYCEAGYLAIDPTVAHGMRSTVPLVWSDHVFKDAPQLWNEAQACGLRVGWAQSCFDAQGGVGMLSLARSHEVLSRVELADRAFHLAGLTTLTHQWLGRALGTAHRPTIPLLSLREVEVLRWTADGKTSDEVARLLGISIHTVYFHVRNIIAKMSVANKTAAVVRATALGLLN